MKVKHDVEIWTAYSSCQPDRNGPRDIFILISLLIDIVCDCNVPGVLFTRTIDSE